MVNIRWIVSVMSLKTLPDVHLLLSTAEFSLEGDIIQNPNDHKTFLSEKED